MKVVDPQGRTWRVSRRWMPWRRKTRFGSWGDGPVFSGSLGDDPISAIIGIVLLILFIPVLVLGLVVALEMLLLLLVLPFAIVGRMLLGRHWRVEVRERWTFAWEAEVGDWSDSGRAIDTIARGLRQGMPPWQAAGPVVAHGLPRHGLPPEGQPPPPR
ncbi:hypothetical protein [Janibacter limosus]|uniref:hypothetical protein n=1 Tax=Janibacter limosus TaxID=53458 RepID=UPI00082FBFE7|nr:hypothetical protein [Janibacter limosus]